MKTLSRLLAALLLFLAVFTAFAGAAAACVGKTITIGVPESIEERMLAELVAVLVNERTGTKVDVKIFADPQGVFDAVKKGEVGVLIENTDHALRALGEEKKADFEDAYSVSKAGYRKRFGLVWLKRFGLLGERGGKPLLYAPVLTTEIMRSFPALPRVINKLARVIGARAFGGMLASARSGKELKAIARDYLRSKRLI